MDNQLFFKARDIVYESNRPANGSYYTAGEVEVLNILISEKAKELSCLVE
jgi:hypothetical protein